MLFIFSKKADKELILNDVKDSTIQRRTHHIIPIVNINSPILKMDSVSPFDDMRVITKSSSTNDRG